MQKVLSLSVCVYCVHINTKKMDTHTHNYACIMSACAREEEEAACAREEEEATCIGARLPVTS
jgi:hypothetical protein